MSGPTNTPTNTPTVARHPRITSRVQGRHPFFWVCALCEGSDAMLLAMTLS